MAKYRQSSSPGMDRLSNGGDERYAFKSLNAVWPSSIHSNDFLRVRKNGRHLSVALETNLFRAAIFPFKLWTSLTVLGGSNSIMARTFSGLTSIPLWDTMKPKNFLAVTPNAHLFGFSFMLNDQSVSKVFIRSSRWSTSCRLFTNMSST